MAPFFSIELDLLLVSAEVIWMIHKQDKMAHFQIQVLKSVEFRLNNVSRRIHEMEYHRKKSLS